jgi:hypothetical protein
MPKNPLFSSYRTGENRVTASILAVLERVDLAVVESLLSAAIGEATLPFVAFENQIATKDRAGVPDAGITANFRYLFEVKTSTRAVDANQLSRHLQRLDGSFDNERLFVLTPDSAEPEVFASLHQPKLTWLSFQGLDQAIEELVRDENEILSEQTRFLLHELRALFDQEGLLGEEDTVVVAARHAYPEYKELAAYICQPGRPFRDGVSRMGFYYGGAIQPEIPRIRHRRDNVIFSAENADLLGRTKDPIDRELGGLVEHMLSGGERTAGRSYQVFLLSPAEDSATLHLARPVKNTTKDHKGKTWAWTLGQRYTQSSLLSRSPATTTELEEFGG